MKKYILLAAAAISLAACNNDDNILDEPVAAQVSATIGESAVSRATDSNWTPGDAIGITMDSRYVNIKHVTQEGDGNFTADNTLYFKNKREPVALTAYYPYADRVSASAPVLEASAIADHQTPAEQAKFDFLYARLDGVSGAEPNVNFTFSHRMCKLTFIFENGDGTDVSKITSYEISGLVLDGSFNTSTGDCAAKSSPQAPLSITIPEGTVEHGEAVPSLIVFPQTVATVTMKIKDNQNQDYTCNLQFTDNCLESGNNYTYTIIVKKTGLVLKQSGINEWDDNKTYTDAVSE